MEEGRACRHHQGAGCLNPEETDKLTKMSKRMNGGTTLTINVRRHFTDHQCKGGQYLGAVHWPYTDILATCFPAPTHPSHHPTPLMCEESPASHHSVPQHPQVDPPTPHCLHANRMPPMQLLFLYIFGGKNNVPLKKQVITHNVVSSRSNSPLKTVSPHLPII